MHEMVRPNTPGGGGGEEGGKIAAQIMDISSCWCKKWHACQRKELRFEYQGWLLRINLDAFEELFLPFDIDCERAHAAVGVVASNSHTLGITTLLYVAEQRGCRS